MSQTEALETTKEEVSRKLEMFSVDMLRMEYLENCLKRSLPHEVRKFAHLKLAELYENRLMHGEAIKHMENVAEMSTSFKDKKEAYMKKIDMHMKLGAFMEIDDTLKKALACVNTPAEKNDLKNSMKDKYLQMAQKCETEKKYNHALKFYEKIFVVEPNNPVIIKKLADMYNKVGKVREAIKMEGLARGL